MLGQWPRVSRGEGEAGQAFSANQQLRREERRAEGRQSPLQLQDRARKKGIAWATARLWWGRAFEKMGAICDSERDGRHSGGYF